MMIKNLTVTNGFGYECLQCLISHPKVDYRVEQIQSQI